jgi:hypothetical protein
MGIDLEGFVSKRRHLDYPGKKKAPNGLSLKPTSLAYWLE